MRLYPDESCFLIVSAMRKVKAAIVNVGFAVPPVGKFEDDEINKFV